MDLESLALFVDVARARSFAAVARDRGIDPSSVSRTIAALEAGIGARLFQRTTRAMVLTEIGETYLARAPALLEAAEQLRDEAASARADPVGKVRLTTSIAFGQTCLGPLLGRFAQSFPRLDLELILTDSNLDLVQDRIDLAIRFGESHRADVVGERLFDTRYRVVASPDYLRRNGRPVEPADIATHACLLFALPDFRTRWLFRDATSTREVPVRGQFVISNALTLRQAACNGLGLTLLAHWLVDADIASGRLVDLFPNHACAATSFGTAAWLLWPSQTYLPRRTRTVMDFLRNALGQDGPRS